MQPKINSMRTPHPTKRDGVKATLTKENLNLTKPMSKETMGSLIAEKAPGDTKMFLKLQAFFPDQHCSPKLAILGA